MPVHTPFLGQRGVPMPGNEAADGLEMRASPDPARQVGAGDMKSLEGLLEQIRHEHGKSLQAILVYGSWLRGKRDTMLDFYVLVDDYRSLASRWQAVLCRLLPPNVYHIHQPSPDPGDNPTESRAKYALLTLERFHRAMRKDFHSYFWARFAQPCEVLFARDNSVHARLEEAFTCAEHHFLQAVLPAMGDSFTSRELWASGLAQTYACELRTENRDRGESIYSFAPDHYDLVTHRFAKQRTNQVEISADGVYTNLSSPSRRKLSPMIWWTRRVQGKVLSVLRLTKASLTFNDALDYLLWKIRRHSGIYIEPTERQRRHPLIFAWPLLWKLYRKGAFR